MNATKAEMLPCNGNNQSKSGGDCNADAVKVKVVMPDEFHLVHNVIAQGGLHKPVRNETVENFVFLCGKLHSQHKNK